MQWGRNYVTCRHTECRNWIWEDKLRPGTRCRKCGTWWQQQTATGKGKGQGHGQPRAAQKAQPWLRRHQAQPALDTPPGLPRLRPLKQSKEQASAVELIASTWSVIPEAIQAKLTTLGYGPPPPEEPELTELLKSHMTALPQEVQAVVTKLTQPMPDTEKELANKLKAQVGELKTASIKKNQLQSRLDQIKSQYAAMLQDMQDLQTRLSEGQTKLKQLSDQYMKVTQTPMPEGLEGENTKDLPIPMAVETFVTSLGIDLTEDQRTQLHGLLKRPPADDEDIHKRRKTDSTPILPGTQCG